MRFAAKMDPRLRRCLRRLRLDRPAAETAREVGAYASFLGILRPSYGCLRRHIADEVVRRAERDAALETAAALSFTRIVVPTTEGVAHHYRKGVERRLGG